MANDKDNKAEGRVKDPVFAKLLDKVSAALEIKPDSSYLLLVKKGALSRMERDVFISLWRRNLKSGALIFEVDDPQKDVAVFEVKKGAA